MLALNPKEYLGASYSTAAKSGPSSASPPASSSQDVEMSEPTGLIAKSGIELLTFGTPNGYKISILLEELKEAYGLEYTWQSVNITKGTQKQPWFTAVNPNGRIPALVDHDRGGLRVFEGLAILNYLARTYDREHRLSFDPAGADAGAEFAEAESWTAWQHGGLGPMQGQANHFLRFAPPGDDGNKIPYAVQRYVGETERLYGVLEARLAEPRREYVAGAGPAGRFSVADISILGWADVAAFAGVDLPARFPRVRAWLDRCRSRPAVRRGFAVPFESSLSNAKLAAAEAEGDPEKRRAAEETRKLIRESKEKFGYKYSSP
ncbi:hypothetical protein SLS62_004456 [Diatrype stigma]|uniref:Glutathione S-transferase II n=1 Tax=Diatrype stigma TaxID=117547 RepID=A0AAN9UT91_9PEZI